MSVGMFLGVGIAGFMLGVVTVVFVIGIFQEKKVIGTIRIDRSIENEGPYLFLEIDKGSIDDLSKKDIVSVRVIDENYISR